MHADTAIHLASMCHYEAEVSIHLLASALFQLDSDAYISAFRACHFKTVFILDIHDQFHQLFRFVQGRPYVQVMLAVQAQSARK